MGDDLDSFDCRYYLVVVLFQVIYVIAEAAYSIFSSHHLPLYAYERV
jgi:hypothetical protein